MTTALGDAWSSGRLLDRILAAPHPEYVVPRLLPEVLHRVIQQCGLEDCGQLVALATPGQLGRVFDLDLWRPAAPGGDAHFDGNRFGEWLEVMIDTDVSGAAGMLAAMDADLIVTGFVQHVRVFDSAAVAPFVTLDGDIASTGIAIDDALRYEVGGFLVSAKRSEFWDAITAVLRALADAHPGVFEQVMRRCCRLSNSRPEVDGLDDLLTTNEQAIFDLALERETQRDTQGYVTPAQARGFLRMSRQIDLREAAMPPRDPITRAHFRGVDARQATGRDKDSYECVPDHAEAEPDVAVDALAAIVDVVNETAARQLHPRRLLDGPEKRAPRVSRLQVHLRFISDRDPDAFGLRSAELAYLANVIVSGSTIQSRPFTEQEASNAAVAVCNLGMENWPVQWLAGDLRRGRSAASVEKLPEDFLIRSDLVTVFQVGLTVLHEDVCMYAAERLINLLSSLRCADREVQVAVGALRTRLMKHWRAGSPWNARDALDVIAILDTPAWAALLGLIDQLPTLHAAVDASLNGTTRPVDPTAFEFISENAQIQRICDFMQSLPGRLRS